MRYIKDDRRYMDFETRAIDDARYRGEVVFGGTKAVRTCFCGKTVIEARGVKTGVTCPRNCEADRGRKT